MVIQVLNNNSIGMDNWEDRISASRNTYDNVISVRNKCEVPASLAAGDEFWFTPGSSHSSVCIFCDMLDFPPSVSYDIQNVSLTACSN